MAKEVAGLIKLQIKGGAANPSPPVGPALGSKGINIMGFCKEFNARTQDKAGKVIPVVITYYRQKVASVTWEQIKVIAEDKMKDLNCFTVESAMRLIAGTARSMGITVNGEIPGK